MKTNLLCNLMRRAISSVYQGDGLNSICKQLEIKIFQHLMQLNTNKINAMALNALYNVRVFFIFLNENFLNQMFPILNVQSQ